MAMGIDENMHLTRRERIQNKFKVEKPERFQFSSKLRAKKKREGCKKPLSIYYRNMDAQFKQLKPRRADDIVEKCFRCQMKHTQGWQYDIDGKKYIICSYCYQRLKKTAIPVHLSYYPWRN